MWQTPVMADRRKGIHVATSRRNYKGKVYESHLLRRSFREDGKVKKETLANLTPLGTDIIDAIRRMLAGETLVNAEDAFDVVGSRHHGHVDAVVSTMKRLKLDQLLGSRNAREKALVLEMIAARVLEPQSKLATTRWRDDTTIAEALGTGDVTPEEYYGAMDWLVGQQSRIEKRLADRHLESGGMALFDLSSSYVEGRHCELAALGYSRDGRRGKPQVNYGVMTNAQGCPVSVSVFPGNVGDPTTFLPQVAKVRDAFGIRDLVMVGDRGMITQKQIDVLRSMEGLDWITALRAPQLQQLAEEGALQLDLFDERNLCEIAHPSFPGERLVACRNPALATRRARKRQALLEATEAELKKVAAMVERGRLRGADVIGVRVGKVIATFKMAKHFKLTITDDRLEYALRPERIHREASLDGIYVIRTSVSEEHLDSAGAVRSYKQLAKVERAFRTMKSIDIRVRPIHHRLEDRVRAHIFLCMLAYYVQWHMREAWRPILFSDDNLAETSDRDPVAPADRSVSAYTKASTQLLPDGTTVHSFRTLMRNLSTIVRNTCRRHGAPDGEATFTMDTQPTAEQRRAIDLLKTISL